MPSLGKFDPLKQQIAEKGDIEQARLLAESIVTVGPHTLQFDQESRERMRLVLKGAEDGDQINWKMLDNSVVAFLKGELQSLYDAAEIEAGKRLLRVHVKAQSFKKDQADGKRVTLRDIHIDNW